MAETITIPQIQADVATDYASLRQQGIAWLQQLSGDKWTDYNEHDPGVTILEELCYVLTELYERTSLPMEDILTQKDGSIPAASNGLFSAAEILQNNPLRTADFQKILIDRIAAVNNAWVEPCYFNSTSDPIGIRGMYRVTLDLIAGISTNDLLRQQVAAVLLEYRNLGEIFPPEEILILQTSSITLHAQIYVAENTNVEEKLGYIFYLLENYVKPRVDFHTYEELVQAGYSSDQIFDGPALQHGFILDDDLSDKVSVIYMDSLLKQITAAGDVGSVVNLYITAHSDIPIKDKYLVPRQFSATIDIASSLDHIRVFKNNVAYQFNKNLALSNYNQLNGSKKRPGKFKQGMDKLNIDIPQGTYRDPARYFSIQNEFPKIYGLGPEKLPAAANEARKAQALQLKGYLLFFEQLLADYMQQVANTNQLLSSSKQDKTFFYQPLYTVPDGLPLLKGFKSKPDSIYSFDKSREYLHELTAYPERQNEYVTGLEALYQKTDNFTARRNLFLDHLLARFNFVPSSYVGSYTSAGNSGYSFDNIKLKEEILKNIPGITASRGSTALHPFHNGETQTDWAGTLKVFRILSGLKPRDLSTIELNQQKVVVAKAHPEFELAFAVMGKHKIHLKFRQKDFQKLVTAAMQRENYTCSEYDDSRYLLTLTATTQSYSLFTLEKQTPPEETTSLIAGLRSDFLKLYLQYENMALVEHICLKPDNLAKRFALFYPDSGKQETNPVCSDYSELGVLLLRKDSEQWMGNKVNPVIAVALEEAGKFTYVSEDFYSSRISMIIPESAAPSKTGAFRKYFNDLVVSNFPAHVCVEVLWLNEQDFGNFLPIYERYISNPVVASLDEMTRYLLEHDTYYNRFTLNND